VSSDGTTRIPLFPLPNVVHFPGTQLRLHVFEPRYRRLVQDLLEAAPEQRFIGMVLMKPAAFPEEPPEVFPEGTAGLLIDVDLLPDGRSNILLLGDFRFTIEREVASSPYRAALVHPHTEAPVNEREPGVLAMRQELVETIEHLAEQLGDRFPLRPDLLSREPEHQDFELLVNSIAADIDLPTMTKQTLLADGLAERANHLLAVLRGRAHLLDLLRPFRHLAGEAEWN
jgi:uncharacterized protein